jgi:hypothetical protein
MPSESTTHSIVVLPSNSRTTDSQGAVKSAELQLLCKPSRGLCADFSIITIDRPSQTKG